MRCDKCGKDFKEREIHEHHLHPRFMNNKKGDGKKSYLCEKCHNILHLLIPTILWKFIPPNLKKGCIEEVIKFSKNYGK